MRNRFLLIAVTVLLLFQTAIKAQPVQRLKDTFNVKYATNLIDWKGKPVKSLSVDLYYPPEAIAGKKYPLILFCHAGGFTGGDRTNVSSECDMFSGEGFIAASLDYRVGYDDGIGHCPSDTLSMNEEIYRAMQDVNACLRFLTLNANKFSIDTARLFLGGASAGASLTLHDYYVTDSIAQIYWPTIYQKLGSTQTSGNAIPYNYKLKGLCAMWGGMPNHHLITPQSGVPTILFKGGEDDNLPDGEGYFKDCENYPPTLAGRGIYDAMIAVSVPCVYHFNPLAPHAAYDDLFCIHNTACFFKAIADNNGYSGLYRYYTSSCH